MNNEVDKEEYLERLWYLKEEGHDAISGIRHGMGDGFDPTVLDQLALEGLASVSPDGGKVSLTEKGEAHARQLIRAHRLAERMLHDVFGGDYEEGACEFEHTMRSELVDGICTLLNHPRKCPHGLPIPEGECCKRADKFTQSSVIRLTEMAIGKSAQVAYVSCESDKQLHQMANLHIRPGAVVKLHQEYPSYVVECEDAHIAMDREMAHTISVWKENVNNASAEVEAIPPVSTEAGSWISRLFGK